MQTSSYLVIFLGWFLSLGGCGLNSFGPWWGSAVMPGFFQAFRNPFGLQMLWGLQTLQRFSLQISSWLVVSWGKERSVNSVINNRLGSTYTTAFCRHHGAEQSLLPIKSSGAVKMDAPLSSSPVFYFFLSKPAILGCSFAQLQSLHSLLWDP